MNPSQETKIRFTSVDYNPFAEGDIEHVFIPIEPQKEIWVSCIIGGNEANCAYNESISLQLKGHLNVETFKNAMLAVIERHEALRSSFSNDGNHVIVYQNKSAFVINDLSIFDKITQDQLLADHRNTDAIAPFDLEHGPLIRMVLFKLSDTEYLFTFTAHHIICDGWSMGTILEDLSTLYSAELQGKPANLPTKTAMSTYAAEVNAFLQSDDYRATEAYWLEKFNNGIPTMELATDFPRPKIRTYKSRQDDSVLNKAFANQIKNLGAKADSSFVTTLLVLYEIFLSKLSGKKETIIGLPTAGQSAAGNLSLVGHCVNLLPITGKINENSSFLTYLRKRKTEILDDLEHQMITFGTLVKKLNIKRDASRVPLIPIVFNVDMGMDSNVSFFGIEHLLISNPREYETFDLFLNVSGGKDAITLEWSYNTQLFAPTTINRMMEQFDKLMKQVVAFPEITLKSIVIDDVLPLPHVASRPHALVETPEKEKTKRKVGNHGFSDREKIVAKIWQKILNVEDIQVDDDFFELGGHSLLAVQVANAIEKETSVRPKLTMIFEYPVLRDFVVRVFPSETGGQHIPSQKEQETTAAYKQTGHYHTISKIWAHILQVNTVEENDDFFELGGHSLLLPKLMRSLEQATGKKMPLTSIFKYPTLHQFIALYTDVELKDAASNGTVRNGNTVEVKPGVVWVPTLNPQKDIWIACVLGGDDANKSFNLSISQRFTGALDVKAMENAFNVLVERHESLRSKFNEDGSMMGIENNLTFTLDYQDISHQHSSEHTAAIDRYYTEHLNAPFDLAQSQLFRVALFRLAPNVYQLSMAIHHIICDGFSLFTLLNELSLIYGAKVTGQLPQLQPAMPFSAYTANQHDFYQSQEYKKQESYWLDQLKGELPTTVLPYDFDHPEEKTFDSNLEKLTLDRELFERFKKITASIAGSASISARAVLEILLYKFTGHRDIITGMPVAGHLALDNQAFVANCVNTLPLRTTVDEKLPFTQYLRKRRSDIVSAYENQGVTFGSLIRKLGVHRDFTRYPLVPIMFDFDVDALGFDQISFEGLTAQLTDDLGGFNNFESFVNVSAVNNEIVLYWSYNKQLLTAETVLAMMNGYVSLLEQISKDPESTISDLTVHAPESRPARKPSTDFIIELNATECAYPKDASLLVLFEQTAKRFPNRTAVVFNGKNITYADLAKQSNKFAALLIEEGIKRGDIVGVALDRVPELFGCLLGIMKAGAAYIPLDPQYPKDRIEFMLADSSAKLFITSRDYAGRFTSETRELLIDDILNRLENITGASVDNQADGNDLAYVLYTSGSTGMPKGVQIEHHSLVNFLLSMKKNPGMSENDILLALTTISFDIAGLEFYLPLISGATVILADSDTRLDSNRILEIAKSEGVTVLQATPATWRMMLESGWDNRLQLKALCGGEAFPTDLAEKLLERCHEVWNVYGPTETTIWSTVKQVTRGELPITVGKPIDNTQVYILDEQLAQVAVGQEGEIYIGGDGVARGYLNRPELNAERFLSDPFSSVPGAKFYRTGDLGKILPNGEIQCLGRIDTQVKIRGFRIELGEIEYHLNKQDGVKESVVVAREDRPGDQRLVAYVLPLNSETRGRLPLNGTPADKESIKRWKQGLLSALPPYMVPNDWVLLPEFPLTPNKKIDRKALPAPNEKETQASTSQMQPEKAVAAIWAELLGLDNINPSDDFFELGGHSLLIPKMVKQVEKETGIRPNLTAIFKYPTLGAFIKQLFSDDGIIDDVKESVTDNVPIETRIPILEPQKEILMACLLGGEDANKSYTLCIGVDLKGTLQREILETSLQQAFDRHESLRSRVSPDGTQLIIPSSQPINYHYQDLTDMPAEEQTAFLDNRLRANQHTSLDLYEGSLFKVALFKLSSQHHHLSFVGHHIVCDGWSFGVFLRDLNKLYTAYTQNTAPRLNQPISLAAYADEATQFAKSERYAEIERYWVDKLKTDVPQIDIPTDYPRPAQRTFKAAQYNYSFQDDIVSDLSKLGKSVNSSLTTVLIAAFEVYLQRLSGQSPIGLGVPTAGQLVSDKLNLVGHCVNFLPIISKAAPTFSFRDYLKQRKSEIAEDYKHKQITLGSILQKLNLKRDLSRIPLVPILFNVQAEKDQLQTLHDIQFEFTPIDRVYDNFELFLNVIKTANRLRFEWSYNTQLYALDTIKRMMAEFESILRHVAKNYDEIIADIPMASQQQLWQGTLEGIAKENKFAFPSLQELLDKAMSTHAQRIAVIADEKQLTYRELNDNANLVADSLIKKGIRPGDMVGIFAHRSTDTLVALLGTIKSGAAYVPLDPSHPVARVSSILSNIAVKCVISSQPLSDDYGIDANNWLTLPISHPTMTTMSAIENPQISLSGESPVYVLHTSGSTGTPKAIAVNQATLVNLLLWQSANSIADEQSVTLQFSSLAFDVSFQEIFSTWLSGGRLCLVDADVKADSAALIKFIEAKEVNRLFMPFAALQALTETAENLGIYPQSVQEIITAGEQLNITPQLLHFFEQIPSATLFNQYGPTETHVVTQLKLEQPSKNWPGLPTIGRPIANTYILILDEQLRIAPFGAVGELCIYAKSLSKGYINAPELNGEKFIHWAETPSGESIRIYRTGDYARYSTDGNIEFLGRRDQQVKLHGYRIELGEIEAQVNRLDQVVQSVVCMDEDHLGNRRLLAFVKLKDNRSVNAKQQTSWRRRLQTVMPDYMIPHQFLAIKEFPRTHTGKIDRKALASDNHVRSDKDLDVFVAPRTPMEQLVARIWQTHLGIDAIGIDADFFQLGGYSVIAVKVVLAIGKELGLNLPLTSVFKYATLSDYASYLEEKQAEKVARVVQRADHTFHSISQIWAEALNTELVREDDDFFALGGHSLLLPKLMAKIEKATNKKLPLTTIFKYPTLLQFVEQYQLNGQERIAFPDDESPSVEAHPKAMHWVPTIEPQKEIWIASILGGDDANKSYNLSVSLRLMGPLDEAAMKRSLQTLVDRHESLRAKFSEDGSQMGIFTQMPLHIHAEDISSLSGSEQQQYIANLNHANEETPFDLSNGPLFKTSLLKLGLEEYHMTFCVHHVVCDGWSLGVMAEELGALYSAYAKGEKPQLAKAASFSSYSKKRQDFYNSDEYQQIKAYWISQHNGSRLPMVLPTDFERHTERTYKSNILKMPLDRALFETFKQKTSKIGGSVAIGARVIFEILLSRYTKQADIVTGMPVAGQLKLENQSLVANCVNTLPLRAYIDNRASFNDYLGNRRLEIVKAYANEGITFGSLLRKLDFHRDNTRSSFVSVIFDINVDPLISERVHFHGMEKEIISNWGRYNNFEFFASIAGTKDLPILGWAYNTQLFKEETIKRLMHDFQHIMRQVVANPNIIIGDLETNVAVPPGVHPIKFQQGDIKEHPKNIPTTDLFTQQAKRSPDKIALRFGEEHIAYGLLDRQSNQFANYLMEQGVNPGDVVGLALDRVPELVSCLLGIMKAGAAYVPLDPLYPTDRITFMLEDSKAKVLVTSGAYENRFESAAKEVTIEDFANRREEIPVTAPKTLVTGSDLAYILYTSGSTGKPKGVQIEHSALVNFLLSMQHEPGMSADDTLLALTTISFDIAGLEMYLPLISGATLVLADADTRLDSQRILDTIKQQGITVLQATPATWRMMLQSGWDQRLAVKALCGGEAFPTDLAEKLMELCDEVWNVYGPTETTIWSTVKQVKPGDLPITVGKPIDNTQVYILDEQLNPLPQGEEGEIYIGGDGVARGYLNRPELNAERFLVDPFTDREGAKIYRTGDLGKILPNGEILCLGRIDNQVKIRGFRIELGEIEYHLNKLDDIKESVVIAREDHPGDQRLVAYLLVRDGEVRKGLPQNGLPADKESIKRWSQGLRGALPSYMVPNDWVLLPDFPLTPNKKIDRKALPSPYGKGEQDVASEKQSIRKVVTAIWAKLLGKENINSSDDFFELGGHSLLIPQMIRQLEKDTGLKVPMTSIFKHSTLHAFVSSLGADASIEKPDNAEIIQKEAIRKDIVVPATEPQIEIWLANMLGQENANRAYNLTTAIQFDGALNRPAFEQALQEIIDRHESLRASFMEDGEHLLIRGYVAINLHYEDISDLNEREKVAFLQAFNTKNADTAFDLFNGPLFRASLIKLTEQCHQLFLTLHHSVADGWSNNIITSELAVLYAAHISGHAPVLDAAPSYARYAEEKNRFYDSDEYRVAEDFWMKQHKGEIPVLQLPTDFTRPEKRSYRGDRMVLDLDLQTFKTFKQLAAKLGCSAAIGVRSALELLIYRLSGQEELVTGLPLAGQLETGYENLVGHCVNLLPLKATIDGSEGFKEYLKKRRYETLDALEHKDYTFGSLVKKLNQSRTGAQVPIVSFVINYELGTDELEFKGLEHHNLLAKKTFENFDISLNVFDFGSGITLRWDYNVDLFKAESIRLFHERFQHLLTQLIADPDRPLDQISTRLPHESAESENTASEKSEETPSLASMLYEAAATYSANTAIEYFEQSIDYGTLNAKSNQLARYLINCGISRGDIIAISADRSIDTIIAVLATTKIGAAYLPLDSKNPIKRTLQIIHNATVRALLLHEKDKSYFGDLDLDKHIINEALALSADLAADNLEIDAEDNNLIYVLHTSGSTGVPKGVCMGERALVNLLQWQATQSAMTSENKTLQFSPLTFDVSFQELFATLTSGGTLSLISDEIRLDPAELLHHLESNAINRLFLPFVALQAMAEVAVAKRMYPTALREVMTAGEQLKVTPAIRQFFSNLPDAYLFNQYGPTETHVVTQLRLEGDPQHWPALPSIGTAIQNVDIHILNRALVEEPRGVIGELCIGGVALAAGYLNRAELTEDRFVNYNAGDGNSKRVYRTGDLARVLPSGEIEYLGRGDGQVKIRGYRIELAEVESHLNELPNIKQAAVTVQEDAGGNKRLVAYLITDDLRSSEISPDQLAKWKQQLADQLPDYMLPYEFVQLAKLPYTASGKIDRKSLPKVDQLTGMQTQAEYIGPRTEHERIIAEIWSGALGIDKPSVTANFFEMGGHSLIAIKVMTAIEQKTGKRLPLASLFENATIEKLARLVVGDQSADQWRSLVPIKATGSKPPLYIVHGAGMNVLNLYTLIDLVDVEQPIYGLQAQGLNGIDPPQDDIKEIARYYLNEIIEHNPEGPYFLGGYSSGGIIVFEMAHQLRAMGKKLKFLGFFDSFTNRTGHYELLSQRKYLSYFGYLLTKVAYSFYFLFKYGRYYLRNRIHYIATVLNLYKPLRIAEPEVTEGSPEHIAKQIELVHEKASENYNLAPLDEHAYLFKAGIKMHYHRYFNSNGWEPFLLKGYTVATDVPAHHADIFKYPDVEILAKKLQQVLDQCAEARD